MNISNEKSERKIYYKNSSNSCYFAKFIKKKKIARDIFEINLMLELPFTFVPGQYIWLEIIEMKHADPKGNRRPFSISSIPNEKGEITLIINKSDSGFKKSLFNLQRGEEVKIYGPAGISFLLPEDKKVPLVLIGAGVGISSFLCLMRHILQNHLETPFTVFSVNNSKESALYLEEIANLEVVPFCKGFVLLRKLIWKDFEKIPNLQQALFYIAGPADFVTFVSELLKVNGIFEHQMRFEAEYPINNSTKIMHGLFNDMAQNSQTDNSVFVRQNVLLSGISHSSNHIIITDKDGKIIFANAAAEKMTGYRFSEMFNQTPRLWGGLMSKQFYADLWKNNKEGLTTNAEIINRRKDGTIYEVMSHISPIKDVEERVIGFIATEEDITQIKLSESIARKKEKQFLQLTERISEVFLIRELKPLEKILYVSPAFEMIWGVTRKALYKDNKLWNNFVHKDDRKRINEVINRLNNGIEKYDIEYRLQMQDGTIKWIHEQGELISEEAGEKIKVVGVARDITKEKEVDKVKTEFVSLASHQLRTPLTAIVWNLEMLMGSGSENLTAEQQSKLQTIYHCTKHLTELVNDLLNVSRLETGKLKITAELLSFEKFVESVIAEIDTMTENKKCEIIFSKPETEMEKLLIDKELMREVIVNLISNAIKYSNKTTCQIKLKLEKINDEVEFSVRDNGIGIPKEEQSKIFERFFRAENAIKVHGVGSGLGLYLVKMIVEKSGGKIWFESEIGKGTIFYVRMPGTGMRA